MGGFGQINSSNGVIVLRGQEFWRIIWRIIVIVVVITSYRVVRTGQ